MYMKGLERKKKFLFNFCQNLFNVAMYPKFQVKNIFHLSLYYSELKITIQEASNELEKFIFSFLSN